jgi:hypothetical protein
MVLRLLREILHARTTSLITNLTVRAQFLWLRKYEFLKQEYFASLEVWRHMPKDYAKPQDTHSFFSYKSSFS